MKIIKVEPPLLQDLASQMYGVSGGVSGLGSDVESAAESAPSYDGQFGPLVWPIGTEAGSRSRLFVLQLDNLGNRLGRKAVEFERADNTTINGLNSTLMAWPTMTEFLAQWSKITGIPVATLERYLKLSSLIGGPSFYGLLFAMVLRNSLFSWNGQTFAGIARPNWWPKWLVWPRGNTKTNQDSSDSSSTDTKSVSTSQGNSLIDVPFVSQWNGFNGGGNCGPASVTMAINTFGKNVNFKDVEARMPKNSHGYTDFKSSQVRALLKENGLQEQQVSNIAQLNTQLTNGHPVIIAVDNSQYVQGASGPYPATSGYLQPHIVVVTGVEKDVSGKIIGVFINDPLAVKPGGSTGTQAAPDIGKNFHVTLDQFNAAAGKDWYAAAITSLQ